MLKRMLIGLACCAVLILVTCGFLYANRAGKLHGLQKELGLKQEQLNNSQKIADRLPIARREFLDAQAQLGFLEQGVTSKVYVPTFLRQIEELGRENHLKVVAVRPQPAQTKPATSAKSSAADAEAGDKKKSAAKPPPPDPYDKLELDMEVSGKYWDVVRFMYDITSFPKIIAVNDIQISPSGQTDVKSSPALSVRFNATAFILKQPGASMRAKVVAEAQDGDRG